MSIAQTFSPPRAGAIAALVKAIVSGVAVLCVAVVIWPALLVGAFAHPAFLPGPIFIMAGVLALTVIWLKFGTWPRSGAAFRREAARLNAVSWSIFFTALAAGWCTMATGFLLYVANRAATGLGGEDAMSLPHASTPWLLAALAMGAFVAGSVEETAVRGFMQSTLERRFGVVPAILISGFVWALFHLNHSYFNDGVVLWFGIFLAVSAMLGTIAHRANSVLPGIVIHTGFDASYFLSAGILQPRMHIAPIAYIQSLASPQTLLIIAAIAGATALLSWIAFFRATRHS
jgi:membrane protease YdiL (CAAX protease family)